MGAAQGRPTAWFPSHSDLKALRGVYYWQPVLTTKVGLPRRENPRSCRPGTVRMGRQDPECRAGRRGCSAVRDRMLLCPAVSATTSVRAVLGDAGVGACGGVWGVHVYGRACDRTGTPAFGDTAGHAHVSSCMCARQGGACVRGWGSGPAETPILLQAVPSCPPLGLFLKLSSLPGPLRPNPEIESRAQAPWCLDSSCP